MSWPWIGPNSVPYPIPPSNLAPPLMPPPPGQQIPLSATPANIPRPPIQFNPSLNPPPPFSSAPPPPPNFDAFFPPNQSFRPWGPGAAYPPNAYQPQAPQPGVSFQYPSMPPAPFPPHRGFAPAIPANARRDAAHHHPKKARTDGPPVAGVSARDASEVARKAQKKRDVNPRDAAVCEQVLKKLGAKLPGESKDDIDRWVAERRKNWPSRANVARKLEEKAQKEAKGHISRKDKGGSAGFDSQSASRKRSRQMTDDLQCQNSLQRLATEYCSSSEGEEGEIKASAGDKVEGKEAEPRDDKHAGQGRGNGARNKKRNGRNSRTRARKGKPQQVPAPSRPSLLRNLLEDEIRKEHSALLQAFRYIVSKEKVASSEEH